MSHKKQKNYIPKTYMLRKEDHSLKWFEIDATGKTLGRLATEIIRILRGKHQPTFTPHADGGDGVVIVNAEKIVVTGSKEAQKMYRYYTGFIGGMREVPFSVMKERKPAYIIEHAVKGMMPKTKLGRAQLKRLRIHAGEGHKHAAQQLIKAEV